MNTRAIQTPTKVNGVVIRRLYRFDIDGEVHPIFEIAITQYTGAKCMIPYGIANLMDEQISIGDTLTVSYDSHKQVTGVVVQHTASDQPIETVYPRNCPICGSTLYSKEYVSDPETTNPLGNVCLSSRCHAKAFHRLGVFLASANIELEKTDRRILHHLITRGVVYSPDTLMATTFSQIMEMENVFVTEDDASHFLVSIDRYRNVGLTFFLAMVYGYGIPQVHRDALELLFLKVTNRYATLSECDRMKVFVAYLLTSPKDTTSIDQSGPHVADTGHLDYVVHVLRTFFQIPDNQRSLIQLLEWYFKLNEECVQ